MVEGIVIGRVVDGLGRKNAPGPGIGIDIGKYCPIPVNIPGNC